MLEWRPVHPAWCSLYRNRGTHYTNHSHWLSKKQIFVCRSSKPNLIDVVHYRQWHFVVTEECMIGWTLGSVHSCEHWGQCTLVNTGVSALLWTLGSVHSCEHWGQCILVNTGVSALLWTLGSVHSCEHWCQCTLVNTGVSALFWHLFDLQGYVTSLATMFVPWMVPWM